MNLTVIIPTLGRPAVVARCAEAVSAQLEAGDACVLVVQGTPEERARTVALLSKEPARTAAEAGAHLLILEQEEAGRSEARNRGIVAASTPYVAFLDDDSIPREGWRRAVVAPLEEGEADVVAGRLVEEPDVTTNASGLVGARLTVTGHTRRDYNTPSSGPSGLAPGGNMATFRDLAARAGGFDPLFGPGAIYEDVEFSERLRRRGARIRYEASAEVLHLAVRTGTWWERDPLAWDQERARCMSLIFRRHRPGWWPVMATAYLVAAAYGIVAGRLEGRALFRIASALFLGWRQGAHAPLPLEGGDMPERSP